MKFANEGKRQLVPSNMLNHNHNSSVDDQISYEKLMEDWEKKPFLILFLIFF